MFKLYSHGVLAMTCNVLLLGLLCAYCGASPPPKPNFAETARCCYSECTQTLDDANTFTTTSLTLQNIHNGLANFLECNRDCTFQPDLSLPELMTIQSPGSETSEDLKLSARGSADKDRYIPSLIKMCQATGLRECLRPLAPNTKKTTEDLQLSARGSADKDRYIPSLIRMCQATGLRECLTPLAPSTHKLVERDDSGEDVASEYASPLEADSERCTNTGGNLEDQLDVENKMFRFRGGGGGKGGKGGGGGGGGGHKHSGATSSGDGWALRIGVIVCLVGWVGFVGFL